MIRIPVALPLPVVNPPSCRYYLGHRRRCGRPSTYFLYHPWFKPGQRNSKGVPVGATHLCGAHAERARAARAFLPPASRGQVVPIRPLFTKGPYASHPDILRWHLPGYAPGGAVESQVVPGVRARDIGGGGSAAVG